MAGAVEPFGETSVTELNNNYHRIVVGQTWTRKDCDFFSSGVRCSAWLYLPTGIERPPIVVMGSFLGGEKTFKLPEYAERFAASGVAAYLFDYRNFGGSEGEPRNLVDPWRHLQDWRAAIANVRQLPDVNAHKLALWGASFAGGHVLQLAAEDSTIAAVVSQVPAVDGLASILVMRPRDLFTGILAALRDVASTLILRRPYYVPITAKPGQFALMNTSESEPGYMAIVDKCSAWKNECPARFCLMIPFYRPIRSAARIDCPTLIIAAKRDSLIPIEAVERTAAKIKAAELVTLECGHFDVYGGKLFEENVERMTRFLLRHLVNDSIRRPLS